MYKNTMETGAETITVGEEMLNSLQLRVVVSRKRELHNWSYELCSPFWRLYVNEQAGAFLRVGDKQTELKPGSVYLVPAGIAFHTGLTKPVTHSYVHFYLTGLPHSLHARMFPRVMQITDDDVVTRLSRRWRATLVAEKPHDWGAYWWANALVHAAFACASQQTDASAQAVCTRWLTQAREVRPALTAIEENMAAPPTNDRLAALCSLSANHFIRIFRRAMGLTPAKYALERRLAVAAGMLVGSSKSIEAVAAATGFSDRFHFSRVFKVKFGLSPGAYRRVQHHQA